MAGANEEEEVCREADVCTPPRPESGPMEGQTPADWETMLKLYDGSRATFDDFSYTILLICVFLMFFDQF